MRRLSFLCLLLLIFPAAVLAAAAPLSITTTSLPNARAGYPYSQKLTATGRTTPYTCSGPAVTGPPVNADAAAGRVKADVLLGEDGIARAIRFVR